ncbi:three component ABC system middle component [Micromonospora sp. NPDC048170]|uniref:three component ABC system middle component n=1 Tax=Micromonospora sp. NPDC048170 TaxID=3154819 RepID=UPI0033F6942F
MADIGFLSREERSLYNPAFVGILVIRATQGYEAERGRGCHMALAATAATMSLTPQVRFSLPKSTAANAVSWIEKESEAMAFLAQSVPAYSPLVRNGMLHAMRMRALVLAPPSALHATRVVPKLIKGETSETIEIQRAAYFLGRWLPQAGSMSTILSLLGVRP